MDGRIDKNNSDKQYVNETFEDISLAYDLINERTYIECVFSDLRTLTVREACQHSFVNCKFPSLKHIDISNNQEGIFLSCHFNHRIENHMSNGLFINPTFYPNIGEESELSDDESTHTNVEEFEKALTDKDNTSEKQIIIHEHYKPDIFHKPSTYMTILGATGTVLCVCGYLASRTRE